MIRKLNENIQAFKAIKTIPGAVGITACAGLSAVIVLIQAVLSFYPGSGWWSSSKQIILTVLPLTALFFTAILSYLAARTILTQSNITQQLKSIRDNERFDERLEGCSNTTCNAFAEEVNELLSLIEQKNRKVDEMAGIVDQREQENQLLWLEIEHNLCLAKEEAETDGLTKLYNRKSIEERFTVELEKAQQYDEHLSVLMADLDHFKKVNDTFGHKTGDEVLRIFAETLRNTTRSNDIPARYGGEEFIVVLPETPVEHAIKVAERINEKFTKAVEDELGQTFKGLKCTVSIGVADYPACATEKGKLISAADLALYKAKDEGRNRVAYYGDVRHLVKKSA